ncbi:MAG: hypothetical protein ACE360_04065 [Hyphomicrobiales bacterium]
MNPSNKSIQLRYEGIDAMEKRALTPYSSNATAANLELTNTSGGTTSSRGYIYTNQLGPRGRPIAFVFAGDTDQADGSEIFVPAETMLNSVNAALLAEGHAYPLFYDTLYDDIREALSELALNARGRRQNVWSADQTNSGFEWTGDVSTLPPVFPKLWRRIDDFIGDETFFDENRPMAGLKAWIEMMKPERVSVPSQGLFTGFDNLIEVTEDRVQMIVEPEKVVISSQTG